ncbi:MAG: MFS transporter [Anaerolineales bacterium]|nr:MFS transporter [Anaerolineales bacterium]
MSTTEQAIAQTELKEEFQTVPVITIASGHFIHDTFTAFVAPLLPLVIEKLSLSLTMAGALNAFMQLPAVLNPFIGYLADKLSLRYFVIFAPAATASLIGLMGLTPSYGMLVFLFVLIGFSVAAFHAPTPAMIARVAGKRVGLGMSMYMAGGELGRTVGPLVAVAGVSAWGLEGIYRLIALGWGASLILFWRFRYVSSADYRFKNGNLKAEIPKLRSLFLPIVLLTFTRAFLTGSITTYLPTFLNFEGATLAFAGISLSVLEAAGVAGALISGSVSDRFGRKPVLLVSLILSTGFLFVFLQVTGWAVIPVLLLLGFFSLAPAPVLLAIVQDAVPDNRAVANGLYMTINFLVRSLVLVLLGAAGDAWGLRTTFMLSGVISIFSLLPVLIIKVDGGQKSAGQG